MKKTKKTDTDNQYTAQEMELHKKPLYTRSRRRARAALRQHFTRLMNSAPSQLQTSFTPTTPVTNPNQHSDAGTRKLMAVVLPENLTLTEFTCNISTPPLLHGPT
eukprot:jgi/Botrbrau1/5/Bobra.0022s0003.1